MQYTNYNQNAHFQLNYFNFPMGMASIKDKPYRKMICLGSHFYSIFLITQNRNSKEQHTPFPGLNSKILKKIDFFTVNLHYKAF